MNEKTRSWHQDSPFTTPSAEDWRESVDKLLDGADFDRRLVSKTFDDVAIQPLYQQRADAPLYHRGSQPWAIQQTYRRGSIESVNQNILADLSEGLTAIELSLPAGGAEALPCYQTADLQHLLTGVHPQMVELALTPGSSNKQNAALLLSYYQSQKLAPEEVRCALNIDPLGAMAATGQATVEWNDLSQFADHCSTRYTNISSIGVDSSPYHNAGCSDAQELACLLATLVEYIRAIETLEPEQAFKQIRFRVALDSDYFMNVAKLRAARELISQTASHCGAADTAIVIDAISGMRTQTSLDSSVNILRSSTQAASAMAGGANGFNCAPYDLLTGGSDRSHRLARNTQHVLIEESGLLQVDDPARGSGYIESLTQSLCTRAWSLFQSIESAGGMQKALTTGMIAEQIKDTCKARTESLANGKTTMVGVTDFANTDDAITVTTVDNNIPTGSASNKKQLNAHSVGELVDNLANGESTKDYAAPDTVTSAALTKFRDAQLFEKLRQRSQQFHGTNSKPPQVLLITLGSKKDYTARVNFCRNFFAVAGIETELLEYTGDVALNNINSVLSVLCSSDAQYLEEAEALFSACNAAGNTDDRLWIAGNNKEVLARINGHSTEALHLRCDKPGLLDKALTLLGAPQ